MTKADSSAERPGSSRPHFTGRAAILAVVLCAIALSLAYPVREYIAQRRQIYQLQAQGSQIAEQQRYLEGVRKRLTGPRYIEQQARDRLLMCFPAQTCYVLVDPGKPGTRGAAVSHAATPWYARLWSSVQQADAQRADAHHGTSGHRAGARRR